MLHLLYDPPAGTVLLAAILGLSLAIVAATWPNDTSNRKEIQ